MACRLAIGFRCGKIYGGTRTATGFLRDTRARRETTPSSTISRMQIASFRNLYFGTDCGGLPLPPEGGTAGFPLTGGGIVISGSMFGGGIMTASESIFEGGLITPSVRSNLSLKLSPGLPPSDFPDSPLDGAGSIFSGIVFLCSRSSGTSLLQPTRVDGPRFRYCASASTIVAKIAEQRQSAVIRPSALAGSDGR